MLRQAGFGGRSRGGEALRVRKAGNRCSELRCPRTFSVGGSRSRSSCVKTRCSAGAKVFVASVFQLG